MDLLVSHLNKIKVAGANNKVYKDECVYSFDSPDTETGLYVSLSSFLGLGRSHVERYHQKTGHAVYLHLRRIRHEIEECSSKQGDGPDKKVTRLAIGVEGGFQSDGGKKFEYEHIHEIVVLPSFATISWPNDLLPDLVKQSVTAILEATSARTLADLESLSGTWDGESRVVSKHCENLVQLDNNKKIPPLGWQCERCDKTENLWLNLTDGSIHCGRKFFDGSGGNNHAVEHYQNTGYPLAVKLGTITGDGKADVFSYAEDDMVIDSKLTEHLAHFGINVAMMEKTEKSMAELELELNKRTGEWTALQESESQLQPLYGPGLTGMENLGNSCYLNSVMQMLFTIPDFISKYVEGASALFDSNLINPADDFNIQMAKLGVGLVSGKYCESADLPGISSDMFKSVVGRGHPVFSTKQQQDAQEFFLHLLNLLERNNRYQNPGECFKFEIEERVQCGSTKKVKYLHRADNLLSLNIPLEAVYNKEEVTAYEVKKLEADTKGIRLDASTLVRPKIKLFSCLEAFMKTEIVEQFYSSALQAKTTARKTTRFSTFPDYLLIQLKKFTIREDWVPIKLNVEVDMPDVLDIQNLRGSGLQPDEELLPEIVSNPPPPPTFDEKVFNDLLQLGFPPEACKRAIFFTKNSGIEAATNWIMEHITDADLSDPFVPPGTENVSLFVPDPEALSLIISMGFTERQALIAVRATGNNAERAVDWIFSHPDELDTHVPDAPSGQPQYRDGNGQYKLVAFVSHMGTSSSDGHYVVHILKKVNEAPQWVIFNDSRVALSTNPPKSLGYLYLYKRI